jgi:hypothetical protein
MVDDAFDFRWEVARDGYEWIDERVYVNDSGDFFNRVDQDSRLEDEPQWVLTKGIPLGAQYFRSHYAPLKSFTGLYRTFADLPPQDREAIAAFARTYGLLGLSRGIDSKAELDGKTLMGTFGETWKDWTQAIVAMRRAVEIWDMFETKDVTGLLRYVRWEEQKPPNKSMWVYYSHPEARDGGDQAIRKISYAGESYQLVGIEPVLDLFVPGDVTVPASFLVQRWINKNLKGHTSAQLRYDIEDGKRILQVFPDSLLSAMWLQFARSVAGNLRHRPCKECGRWIEVSPVGVVRPRKVDGRLIRNTQDRFRMNREFCSDACKSRNYRDRRDRAQRLKQQGKTVAGIAAELGTPVETIKKWTTKRKG